MKIPHISISREGCYRECPKKYHFRYHLEVIPEGPPHIYLTFGSIVHRIIEEHTKGKGQIPIDKIIKDVLSGKIEINPGEPNPPLDVEHKNKLKKHLEHYLRLAEKIGYDGDIEWEFKIDMDGNKRFMTGYIDRVIIKNDSAFLLDWKTTKPSKWRTTDKTITKDLQLMCYCYVVWKQFNIDPKNIQAALMFLDDNKLVPVRFSEQTLLAVPERLLKVYKEIETTDPDKVRGNVGNWCQRCEFAAICPFYKTT
jgi:hypothetical protein